ncbi:MAG: sulfoquinovose isomerase, partial [Subtercola sp.]|nr:sulfoquinovose isomerase [Subtercola sp.]
AEAVAAASVLARVPGGAVGTPAATRDYAADYERWLDHIATHYIDHEHGSWRQRLEPTGAEQAHAEVAERASGGTRPGKADLYHSLQSMMIPQLPVATSMVAAIALSHG